MTTVGDYLLTRMHQAGVSHAFGVPGDYVLDLMDRLVASPIELVCTCNELNAGYAADAYARLAGIGAVVVTYGVGAMSLINAVAGAYAERVPMIVVSGSPHSNMRRQGMLMHHLAGDYSMQRDVMARLTGAGVLLTDGDSAPGAIDEAIALCVRGKQPVYIEAPVDVVGSPCVAAGPWTAPAPPSGDPGALSEAVAEAVQLLAAAQRPAVMVGMEVRRFGLAGAVSDLLERTGWPFAATIDSKSTLPESHPHYLGVYQGGFSDGPAHDTIEAADGLLTLGAWMTDITTGGFTAHLDDDKMIAVNSDKVRIRRHYYDRVPLEEFISALTLAWPMAPQGRHRHSPNPYPKPKAFVPTDAALTVRRFFEAANAWLDDDMVVISDIGDVIFGATELYRPSAETFLAQGYYMSIGYSVPAALGAGLARPGARPVVFVGDGAMQMTVQEISTICRHRLPAVIIVLNNEGYVIERMIHDGPYNELQNWHYSRLAEVFQTGEDFAIGRLAATERQFADALQTARDHPDRLVIIEAKVGRTDCTEVLTRVGQNVRRLSSRK